MTESPATGGRAEGLLRLVRISLAPSAVADVLVGVVVGAFGTWPGGWRPFALVAASLSIYHGAMALNDWADRAGDAAAHRGRPIERGDVGVRTALLVALAGLVAGAGLAFAVHPLVGLWMCAVALLAVFYDLAGRGPLLGPLLLGACRAGNLGAGILAGGLLATAPWSGGSPSPLAFAPALAYGLYVFFVSRLARLEDDEDRGPLAGRPRRAVLSAVAVLVLVPFLTLVIPAPRHPLAIAVAALVAGWAAAAPSREAWTRAAWTRADVGRCTGALLRRLCAFSAACAFLVAGRGAAAWVVGGVALSGILVGHALRRRFPPT